MTTAGMDTVQEECTIMTTGGIRTVPVHTDMDTEMEDMEGTTVVTTTMDMVEEWDTTEDTTVDTTMEDMVGMVPDMM